MPTTTMLQRCTALTAVLLAAGACASAGRSSREYNAMQAEAIAQANGCLQDQSYSCAQTASQAAAPCDSGERWLVVRNLSSSAVGLYEERGGGQFRLVSRVSPGTAAYRMGSGRSLRIGSLDFDPNHAPVAAQRPITGVRAQGVCVRKRSAGA